MARSFSGTRMRDQRLLAGVRIADLAARVGRSPRALYAYERGEMQPPVPVADGLADALGVRLDVLLADERRVAA
ncbi:helix-turn-helix transcriptional regulator [Streptomyces sp. PA03-6a]|nr:helix-turn-helix transcriptional regulator [Streptomyces sp. PA03-6a]